MNFNICFYTCSSNQKLTLAHQQMTADYEKLRQEEADKSTRLQELMSVKNNFISSSLPCSPNRNLIKKSKLPYFNIPLTKSCKNVLNSTTKVTQTNSACVPVSNSSYKTYSYYINTLHLHLLLSITMILVTKDCPHYLIEF